MIDERREAMIERQLRTTGTNDPAVLAAFRAVDRARFVPASAAAMAYADAVIPLAPGRVLIEPMITGLLLSHARAVPGERVLVIGAGTGYAAALLAAMGTKVTAVEEDTILAAMAAANLPGGVVTGPLIAGAPDGAPFDLIWLDGAAAVLPPALLAQGEGGRFAGIVVGDDGVGRAIVARILGGRIAGSGFVETAAPILPGFARAPEFVF